MEVTVSENLQSFYLAMRNADGMPYWRKVVGHVVTIGNYQFGIAGIPKEDDFELNVSELSTGTQVKTFKNSFVINEMTATKEGTIILYETFIADVLKRIIALPKFESELTKYKKIIDAEYEPMPATEKFDDTILTAPLNEHLS